MKWENLAGSAGKKNTEYDPFEIDYPAAVASSFSWTAPVFFFPADSGQIPLLYTQIGHKYLNI
jgi:hypothetical protein